MSEIWKPVIGYENVYHVSDAGRVKRVLPTKGTHSGRILQPRSNKNTGYYYVNLWYKNKGESKNVHALVADAFLGTKPAPKYVVNHINHIRTDNRAENLEWIPHGENIRLGYERIGYKPGKVYRGSDNNLSKFTESTIISMRNMYATGRYTQVEIARRFGVSKTHASRIFKRKTWTHV